MTRALALAAIAVAAGCVTPSPPEAPADLAHAAVAPPKPAAPAAPITAEVEMAGVVTRPAGVKGEATIWVVDGPCWQPATRAFGSGKTAVDKFFLEVFVPQGSQLWVCAAVGDPAKPLTVYGQAAQSPLLGKGTGEVTFMNLSIPLGKGKKVAAPPRR